MKEKDVFPPDFKIYTMKKYARNPENQDERIMDSLIDLISSSGQWRRTSLHSFLEKVAVIMQRQMNFREVSIALKDRFDGKFRYQLISGYSKEATDSQMKFEYTEEDVLDYIKYPAIKLGRNLIDLCSGLLDQQEELATYTAPSLLKKPRESMDNMAEADYFHAYLYAENRELIGFMEFSKTKDGKFPPRMTIKWIELFCAIVAEIIWEKEYSN